MCLDGCQVRQVLAADLATGIHPHPASNPLQHGWADAHGAVDRTGGWQHLVKGLQALVQVDGQGLGQAKGADSADRVASQVFNLLSGQHLALAQGGLEFGVVYAGMAAGNQQHHAAVTSANWDSRTQRSPNCWS